MSLLENRWQLYLGIITEPTIKKNQRWFHIFVPEFLPTKTGDVTAEDAKHTVKLENVLTNKQEELNYNVTATIYAEYFGFTSGLDVPTMYRNMQVLVLNYSSTDKWYWIPLERDDSYKTFEHYRISCADQSVTNKKVPTESPTTDSGGTIGGLTPLDTSNERTSSLLDMMSDSESETPASKDTSTDFISKMNERVNNWKNATSLASFFGNDNSLLDEEYKSATDSIFKGSPESTTAKKEDKNAAGIDRDDTEKRDATLTDDNTYYIEIDTKYRKHILLSTSASDGEEFRYFMKFDAEAHTVEIWDNCVDGSQPNNTIKIESRPDPATLGRITLQNASGNTYRMNGMDTEITIPRNLMINVGGDTNFVCSGNVSSQILQNFTSIIAGNVSTTTTGVSEHKYANNYSEAFLMNKITTVAATLTRTINTMITHTEASTWTNDKVWTLTSKSLMLTVKAAQLSIVALNALLDTFVMSVSGVYTLKFAQWVINGTTSIIANYESKLFKVAGSIIDMIRYQGGHHGNH